MTMNMQTTLGTSLAKLSCSQPLPYILHRRSHLKYDNGVTISSTLIARGNTQRLTILPSLDPNPSAPLVPDSLLRLEKIIESTSPATVKTPPMIAHVLNIKFNVSTCTSDRAYQMHATHEVKK
jgi:hypothetical protein